MRTIINDKRVLTIRARVLIGFMTLSLPLLLLIIFLLPKVNTTVNFSQKILSENLPQILDSQIYLVQDILEDWAMNGDLEDKQRFVHIWSEINKIRDQWDQAIQQLDYPELKQEWNKLQALYLPFYNAQLSIINAPRDPNYQNNVENSRKKTRDLESQMINLIDGVYFGRHGKRNGGLFYMLSSQIEKNAQGINSSLIDLEYYAYWLLTMAIILTIMVPYMTERAMAIPVNNAINIAERIARGERNIEIQIKSADNWGKLLLSLKTMQEAIKKDEEILRTKEEESRELFEKLVSSSKKFREYSSKVAAGDLRERLEIDREDILQDVGKDLNLMTDGLADITKKITTVSHNIVSMVETVLNSANEQTESVTSQAIAINEISASLEEIDKSSKQTMTRAQALREIAKNTYEQGKLGSKSVEQSIQGIKDSEEKMKIIAVTILDLSKHMQQIGDITLLVNTLAQQLKMLALNASIEASNAGEAGKGFAVVASEVRNLAEQSERSTQQVQKILEDIRKTTEKAVTVTEEGTKALDTGTQRIEKAGQVIQALSIMINEASISSQHIELAIRQEAIGIEQIVENMRNINRTTSTFSSGIKEMMEFIHNLDGIAKNLKEDVNIYKV